MIQYVCDRCEAIIKHNSNLVDIEFDARDSYSTHVKKSLCPMCISALVDFLKTLPKAVPATIDKS